MPRSSGHDPLRARAPTLALIGVLLLSRSASATATHNDDASVSAEPQPARFALAIGCNDSLEQRQPRLRFADDDAARMTELLTESGVDTTLVTAFDRETQGLFPKLVSQAHPPTRKGLAEAWSALVIRMRKAAESGPVELLLYYSGHGDVGPDGRGHLTLAGEKLTRDDLFTWLLSESPADHNHLIIDACGSERLVLARGGWRPDRSSEDARPAVRAYLESRDLSRFPNTGVMLASSIDNKTHEWERYRGGVFTHELLSGLRGGADVNGDGRLEYSELGAFISAANRGVADPRARLRVVVRPPRRRRASPGAGARRS